jgi:hypothetical protein
MEEAVIFYRHRLPHWQPPDAPIFLTQRLFGSFPREVIGQLRAGRVRLENEPKRAGKHAARLD